MRSNAGEPSSKDLDVSTAPKIRAEAKRLVDQFGWNATCYQILNPGLKLWFGSDRQAVIGYVIKARTRVVAGAPICDGNHLPEVVKTWEQEAKAKRESVCYFGASGRLEEILGDCPGYSTVILGSQPVWDPKNWAMLVDNSKSIRAQLNRARNKGANVAEWQVDTATDHPELLRVLQEWLENRGLPPLHFLVEPQTLSFLDGRRIFVATRQDAVIGFLVASPIPDRNGWLTEQFVRGRGAVNGTVELMVDCAMRKLAADDASYVTMGLVPLSNHGFGTRFRNPLWLRSLARWVKAHGRRFYNFDGLEAFKAKLNPDEWEPIYAISNEPRFSMRSLYAIAAAFTHTSPIIAVFKGMIKAFRQEIRWLFSPRETNH